MCLQVIERYAGCGCVYYRHAVDPCAAYGDIGHVTESREVLVGFTCSRCDHTFRQKEQQRAPSVKLGRFEGKIEDQPPLPVLGKEILSGKYPNKVYSDN